MFKRNSVNKIRYNFSKASRIYKSDYERVLDSGVPKKTPERFCFVYLAPPLDHHHSRDTFKIPYAQGFAIFLESLKTVVSRFPDVDILVFNEDWSEHEESKARNIAGIRLINLKVDFSSYKGKSKEYWMTRKNYIQGRPFGYRMMCRFFSGIMQQEDILSNYDYYIRMDHDSFFMEPNFNLSSFFEPGGFDYAYRSVFYDKKEAKSLFEFVKKFTTKNSLSHQKFHKLKILSGDEYNGWSPYNNFHISKVSFWANPLVKKFIEEIEAVDGIICSHWQDANIHAMIIALFAEDLICYQSFGYRHNNHYSKFGSDKTLQIYPSFSRDFP